MIERSGLQVISPVTAELDRVAVERLAQLYMHDFSSFSSADSPQGTINAEGLLTWNDLHSYFREEEKRSWLMRISGAPIGFAVASRISGNGQPDVWKIDEFFVARKYRRNGFGKRLARRIIEECRLPLCLSVAISNAVAQSFWLSLLRDEHVVCLVVPSKEKDYLDFKFDLEGIS